MTKAMDSFNFYEIKTIISALNNLQTLPIKLQEITNSYLKENFGLLKNCFTSNIIENVDIDNKNLFIDMDVFINDFSEA